MKQFGLAPVTLFTLILTGLLLPASGWFTPRSSAPAASTSECRTQARDPDLTSEAAWRYRNGRPHHWRALMLHRKS